MRLGKARPRREREANETNRTMLYRRSQPRHPKRLQGDNELLRRRYAQEMAQLMAESGPPPAPEIPADESYPIHEHYSRWLRDKGIDPDTGRMTLDGFAFFKEVLDADRLSKPKRRRLPPRP